MLAFYFSHITPSGSSRAKMQRCQLIAVLCACLVIAQASPEGMNLTTFVFI